MGVKTELNQEVGARLRALREARGIPRERLALALKMGAENVRHYEAGRTPLTLPMLPAIAELYDITLENLLLELFELRSVPAGRPESDTTRQSTGQPDSDQNQPYIETDRHEFDTSRRRELTLAMA